MLFVSFWNLSLSNLPPGSFTISVISADEARARIASARSEARLLCVSADDLAAPYMRRAYENHVTLCAALAGLGIVLSVKDFFGPSFCNPLDLATVAAGKSLMIISCHYTYDFMPEPSARKGQQFRREVLLDSITFNLLQMSEGRDAAVESQIEVTTASVGIRSASRRSAYVPLARATALQEAGTPFRSERLGAGDMVSLEEAAAIAGTSCETIEDWIAKGRAIGVSEAGRDFRLPRWQFEPALWSILDRISEALGVNEGWAILCFLESAHGGLDGRTPRAAIEQGDALRVIELARGDF